MFGKRSRQHKVLMSDGSTTDIRTDGGKKEAERLASQTSSGVAIHSVQTQKGDDANNLREGGGNH
jgi:hypothetical protein